MILINLNLLKIKLYHKEIEISLYYDNLLRFIILY